MAPTGFKLIDVRDLDGAFVKSITADGLATVQLANNSETTVQLAGIGGGMGGGLTGPEIQALVGAMFTANSESPSNKVTLVYSSGTQKIDVSVLGLLPTGGTTGDILTKGSSTDYASSWQSPTQSDWDESSSTSPAFIENKPTLGSAARRDTGTATGDIPLLVNNGLLSQARIPSLPASRINGGVFADARMPASIARVSELDGTASTVTATVNGSDLTVTIARTIGADIAGTVTLPVGGEDNVQANWAEADTSNDAFILNKPANLGSDGVVASGACAGNDLVLARTEGLPTVTVLEACLGSGGTAGEENVQANWTEADTNSDAFILNKPTVISATERTKLTGIETAATADQTSTEIKTAYESNADTNVFDDAAETKLSGVESGAGANVQSDWSAGAGDALILNKPTLGTAAAFDTGTASGDIPVLGTGGDLPIEAIPSLSASQITSGTFGAARIPGLPANRITSGTIDNARIPAGIARDSELDGTADEVVLSTTGNDLTVTVGLTHGSDVAGTVTLPSSGDDNVQSNWNTTNGNNDAFILNKPTVITADERTKLTGIEANAEANIQSDWNEADTANDAFILNKPTSLVESASTTVAFGTFFDDVVIASTGSTDWRAVAQSQPDDVIVNEGGFATQTETDTTESYCVPEDGIYLMIASISTGSATDRTILEIRYTVDGVAQSYIGRQYNRGFTGATIASSELSILADLDLGNCISLDARVQEIENGITIQGDISTLSIVKQGGLRGEQGIPGLAGAGEDNVQPDWDVTDTSNDAFILNKPSDLGSDGVVASGICTGNDLVLTRTEGLATVTISEACIGSGGSAGEENVQANWAEADANSDAFILNKPTLGTAAALDTGTAAGNVPVLGVSANLPVSTIPNIPASLVTSGEFILSLIPEIPATTRHSRHV